MPSPPSRNLRLIGRALCQVPIFVDRGQEIEARYAERVGSRLMPMFRVANEKRYIRASRPRFGFWLKVAGHASRSDLQARFEGR